MFIEKLEKIINEKNITMNRLAKKCRIQSNKHRQMEKKEVYQV